MQYLIFLTCLLATSLQLPQICTTGSDSAKIYPGESDYSQTKACFSYLIEKGEYESIDALEQSLNDDEEKIMAELLNEEIKRLESIQSNIIQGKSTCEPVLKWAQNMTHLFVAAKLSHRWDSPPCLKTTSQKYELKNSTLSFVNICLVSRTEIKYYFTQKLYKKSKGSLQIKKDGVGEYTLIFQKSEEEVWPFLFENNEKIPVWIEIMNRNSTLKGEYQKLAKQIERESQQQPKKWASYLESAILFMILILII